MLYLSTGAMAVPVPIAGTYSTTSPAPWTLQMGYWNEDFAEAIVPGGGGSTLTAWSAPLINSSLHTGQWELAATSSPTALWTSGGPNSDWVGVSWTYVTSYTGTVTIGAPATGTKLTTGGSVTFALTGANYNVQYGSFLVKGQPGLAWEFAGTGTYLDYVMTIDATYFGAPTYTGTPVFPGPDSIFDNVQGINMTMTITQVPVPEPATMLLLGSGLIGLAGFGRKKLFKKR